MSRTDEVVDEIKRMIQAGTFGPGERLPVENELAATLGVSRSSLREGIRALSILGIVDTRQGDGTYVTSLDPSRLIAPMGFVVQLHGDGLTKHVHEVRRMLETEAAGLAATRIDDAAINKASRVLDDARAVFDRTSQSHERFIETDIGFHRIIATAAGNPVLAALIETLAGRTVRGRLWRSLHEASAVERTHKQHAAILDALRAREPEHARIRMASHLLDVEDFLAAAPADAENDAVDHG